jgi:hypothetical protein
MISFTLQYQIPESPHPGMNDTTYLLSDTDYTIVRYKEFKRDCYSVYAECRHSLQDPLREFWEKYDDNPVSKIKLNALLNNIKESFMDHVVVIKKDYRLLEYKCAECEDLCYCIVDNNNNVIWDDFTDEVIVQYKKYLGEWIQ